MVGYLKSTWMRSSTWSISANTSLFGSNLRRLPYKTTLSMRSLGTSLKVAYIPLDPPIAINSLGLSYPLSPPWFGRFGLCQKSSSLRGFRSKIGFGQMTSWRREVGQIVGIAPIASGCWSLLIIFLSIVVIPLDFRGSLRSGLAFNLLTSMCPLPPLFTLGGAR